MQPEAAELDTLIGALLGTQETELSAPTAKARSAGLPYDPERFMLFQLLHKELRGSPPVPRVAPIRDKGSSATLAFFEAYFSNFIEGTEFAVEEAMHIIFDGIIPSDRPEDAHDVLGTWRMVSSSAEMRQTPDDTKELSQLLKKRHSSVMELRADKMPGRFKKSDNRAGATTFVAPDLVQGTLKIGFEIFQGLEEPFQRAVFMMFLVSEIHPFLDGNGRIARIMMNAELVAAGEERIVIPTVYRGNYLAALKALSQSARPEPMIRMLEFAQKWTASVDWGELNETHRQLERCNAFLDYTTAEDAGKRLKLAE